MAQVVSDPYGAHPISGTQQPPSEDHELRGTAVRQRTSGRFGGALQPGRLAWPVKHAFIAILFFAGASSAWVTASRSMLAGAMAAAGAEPSVAIVVNQSNPVENLPMAELRKIFLGERSHWPNGRRITLVMMDPAQPERKAILHEIYGMSEKDLNQHFVQGVFTGAISASPKTISTPAEVLKFVFNVPGAIGYLRVEDVDRSVKIVRVDGRLPEDKDYTLHMSGRGSKP